MPTRGPRTEVITIHLTPLERRIAEEKATKWNCSINAYARARLLNYDLESISNSSANRAAQKALRQCFKIMRRHKRAMAAAGVPDAVTPTNPPDEKAAE